MFIEIDIENQIRNGFIFGSGCENLLGNIKKILCEDDNRPLAKVRL